MKLRLTRLMLTLIAALGTGCDNLTYLDWWLDAGHGDSQGPHEIDIADLLDHHTLRVERELETKQEGYRSFELTLTQRMDHDDPASAMFEQHIILHHRSAHAPMVLATTGYNNVLAGADYLTEPAKLLNANQIMVEHRYFPPSIPADAEWEHLNILQSATDFHKIVRLFKVIYHGKWISTGASKGGMTSVFHRRFYPDDVDGTVGYVTPISFAYPDDRYIGFLNSINPDGCGDAVKALQRRLIQDRTAVATQLITQVMPDAGLTQEQAEFASIQAGMGLQWTFWQFYGVQSCPAAAYALQNDLYAAYFAASSVQIGASYGDLSAYYYQAATELGSQNISYEHLYDLFEGITFPDPGPAVIPPWGEEPLEFDPAVMQDVSAWIKSDAERLLLIYGEFDPWSGGAIDLGAARDSKKLVVPGGTHGADISQLAAADQEVALNTLFRWAKVKRPVAAPAPAVSAKRSALNEAGPVNTLDELRMRSALPATPQL